MQRLLRGIFAAENYSTILLCYKKTLWANDRDSENGRVKLMKQYDGIKDEELIFRFSKTGIRNLDYLMENTRTWSARKKWGDHLIAAGRTMT